MGQHSRSSGRENFPRDIRNLHIQQPREGQLPITPDGHKLPDSSLAPSEAPE
ncbi:MAG: hypothetical protein IJ943_10815 [Akkermansia sp.]|nr:hypothetical protein [Akkermansia sp.]